MNEYNFEPKVGIVLVNYNGAKFQNDCIKTIKNMNYKNYEIIVVDNASTDESIKMLKSNYNDVIVIENGNNFGVAKGNNIGIKKALERKCEYILLLNNDTELDKELLSKLVLKADNNTITVPKIYYYKPNNLIWYAGGTIDWHKGITQHFGVGKSDLEVADNECKVMYAPTCCFLIHRSIFEKVGFMDENYFMYYDDADFCARAIKENVDILYIPSAIIWHKVSSSTGGENSLVSEYYMHRNIFYFINKFNKYPYLSRLYARYAIMKRLIKWKLRKKNDYYKIVKGAYKDYLNNKMGKRDFQ